MVSFVKSEGSGSRNEPNYKLIFDNCKSNNLVGCCISTVKVLVSILLATNTLLSVENHSAEVEEWPLLLR